MLRARSGKTSSRETFWLIPAIRRSERKGPGIVISAPGEGVRTGAVPTSGRSTREIIRTVCARAERLDKAQNKSARQNRGRRRGISMAGVLSDRKKITPLSLKRLLALDLTSHKKRASLAGQGFYLPGVEFGRKNNNSTSGCR